MEKNLNSPLKKYLKSKTSISHKTEQNAKLKFTCLQKFLCHCRCITQLPLKYFLQKRNGKEMLLDKFNKMHLHYAANEANKP